MKHLRRYSLLLLILPTILVAQIPVSRVMDWSKAGVQGGIPVFTKVKNFNNNGGVPNNPNVDNGAALQALVNSVAGTGTVIEIPAGTYRFKTKVSFPQAGNVVVRGAGADKTILEFETGAINTGNFEIYSGFPQGNTYNVSGGAIKNSTQLTLTTAAGIVAGEWIDISQENDPAMMSTNNPSNALTVGPRAVGQLMKIVSVSGNTITLDRPLHYTYNMSLSVQVRRLKLAEKIGFEDFTIKSITAGAKHHFLMVYAANCWIKCVRSIKSDITHVNPSFCANLTVRDSYFHDAYEFGEGGHGGGVCISERSTDCLIENNVFDKLRHAMLVQRGANGNVFGYNYSINATSSGTVSSFTRLPDGSLHGHFPYMNLYEGNVMQEIHSADYWGPSGHGNTFFRNWVTREGIRISDKSIEQNVVGNDLIKDATATFTSNTIVNESGVINTLIHGNKVNGTVSWNSSLGSNNVIQSYYLSGKPSFFGSTAWPIFGPGATAGTLPAQDRHARGAYTECIQIVQVSNAKFIAQTIPTQVTPGSVTNVSVTLQNNGTKPWIYGNSTGFKLGVIDPISYKWNAGRILLPQSVVNPGGQVTFNFPITAPNQVGTYNYQMQMVDELVEWFGEKTPNVQIQVSAPVNNSTLVYHNVSKTNLQPGESFVYEVTFKNTGTTTWKKTGTNPYYIGTQNPTDNMTWGANRGGLLNDVAPGALATFKYTLKAPATPGIYNLQTQMVQELVEWFGEKTPNVVMTVGTWNSSVVYHNVSNTNLQPGESFVYEITFKNTGTTTWKQGDVTITTRNPDLNMTWGANRGGLGKDVIPGDQIVFKYTLKAPLTPGTYNLQTQMTQGVNNAFGELTPNVVMQVSVSSALMPLATSILETNGTTERLSVYPNPVSDNVLSVVSKDGSGINYLEIMDLNGKQVFEQLVKDENTVTIQPALSKGTYMLRVVTNQSVYTSKIIRL